MSCPPFDQTRIGHQEVISFVDKIEINYKYKTNIDLAIRICDKNVLGHSRVNSKKVAKTDTCGSTIQP